MFNFFRFVYYILYKWQLRVNKTIDWHEQNAVLLLSIFMGFNIMTVYFFYKSIFHVSSDILEITFTNVAIVYIPFIILLDCIFILGGRHKRTVEEFDMLEKANRKKIYIHASLYLILSFLLLIMSGIFYNVVKPN